MEPDALLIAATEADLGIAVETDNPVKLQQQVYRALRKRGFGAAFQLTVRESELYIIRRASVEEEVKNGNRT